MSYKDFINWLSVTSVGRWLAMTFSTRLDPILYRLSGGKMTSVGPQVIPQLVLTTVGRKSGKERTVQLGYTQDGDDVIVVASNFGGQKHPGWSYNLDADPQVRIQIGARLQKVIATRLSEEEKEAVWSKLCASVPQYSTYVTRTDRNIKVYRLRSC